MTSPNAGLAAALDAVAPVFLKARRVVLTTHVNPDGDGIGSEVALASWLRDRGAAVTVINTSPLPVVYRFLDPGGSILRFDAARDASAIASADTIAVLDTNHPDRLRTMRDAVAASRAVKVCIDHHLDPAPFADFFVIDDDATSTGELIYRLLLRLHGSALSPDVATGLYCAIMTDTGSFRYPRVDPETHEIAGHLIECGADPVRIFSEVYERWTPGRLRLLGKVLSGLTTEAEGRIAQVAVTRGMLAETGTTEEDTDNFTTYPMSLQGVEIGILFLEAEQGVKISVRSRGDIPANEICRAFGGNGHKNAAGARVENITLGELRPNVIATARRYLPNHRRT